MTDRTAAFAALHNLRTSSNVIDIPTQKRHRPDSRLSRRPSSLPSVLPPRVLHSRRRRQLATLTGSRPSRSFFQAASDRFHGPRASFTGVRLRRISHSSGVQARPPEDLDPHVLQGGGYGGHNRPRRSPFGGKISKPHGALDRQLPPGQPSAVRPERHPSGHEPRAHIPQPPQQLRPLRRGCQGARRRSSNGLDSDFGFRWGLTLWLSLLGGGLLL